MTPGRGLRRWLELGAVALALLAQPTFAQDPAVSLLTLDQERLFLESAFGKAALAREQDLSSALEAENARIEAELVAEEQDLTDRRAQLPPEEFSQLAAAFDEKVERIRAEQDAKVRDITSARDEDRKAFRRAVLPVLAELMNEKGAVAILNKDTLILSLSTIDVTDEAIAKVDAAFESGSAP